MKTLFSAVLLFAALAMYGGDLQKLLTPPEGSFWNRKAPQLQREAGTPLRWVSRDRTQLRYVPRQRGPRLKWLDTPVCEILFELDGPSGHLKTLFISIYNRGDAGAMEDRKFKRLQEQAETAVGQLAGSLAEPVRERMHMARETVYSRTWTAGEVRWQLLWCESDRGPEYLTLKAVKSSSPVEKLRASVKAAVDKKSLPERLIRDGSAMHMEIPMIDQGAKGYCAAATIARVIRYYGGDVDQNQVAQIVGSDAKFGTSIREMLEKLDREKTMLNVRTELLYEYQSFSTYKDLQKWISRYNRAARSMRKATIRLDDYIRKQGNRRWLDIEGINKATDKEVYRQMRLKDRDMDKFRREVTNAVKQGLPVLWMIPGHIRLIVGIDTGKDEILYSDTWGAGHEKKKMSTEDAFVITTRAFVLVPR